MGISHYMQNFYSFLPYPSPSKHFGGEARPSTPGRGRAVRGGAPGPAAVTGEAALAAGTPGEGTGAGDGNKPPVSER